MIHTKLENILLIKQYHFKGYNNIHVILSIEQLYNKRL
jgi:hypothetical protein